MIPQGRNQTHPEFEIIYISTDWISKGGGAQMGVGKDCYRLRKVEET